MSGSVFVCSIMKFLNAHIICDIGIRIDFAFNARRFAAHEDRDPRAVTGFDTVGVNDDTDGNRTREHCSEPVSIVAVFEEHNIAEFQFVDAGRFHRFFVRRHDIVVALMVKGRTDT